jgi:hypothetical protein
MKPIWIFLWIVFIHILKNCKGNQSYTEFKQWLHLSKVSLASASASACASNFCQEPSEVNTSREPGIADASVKCLAHSAQTSSCGRISARHARQSRPDCSFRSAQRATLLEYLVPLTNCFVRRWFCVILGPKLPLHSHKWLSLGKFQET